MVERTIPLAATGKILRAAGAERVGEDAKIALRDCLEKLAGEYTKEAVRVASHAGRKTVRQDDVRFILKR